MRVFLRIHRIFIKHFFRALLLFSFIAIIALSWLVSTELGLNALIYTLKPFIPGTLSIGKITGTLFKTITLENVNFQEQSKTFKADKVIVKGEWMRLLQNNFKLDAFLLDNAEFHFNAPLPSQEKILKIAKADAILEILSKENRLNLQIQDLRGEYNHLPLQMKGAIHFADGLLHFENSILEWGSHKIIIEPKADVAKDSHILAWQYQGHVEKGNNSRRSWHRSSAEQKIYAVGEALISKGQITIEKTVFNIGKKRILSFGCSIGIPQLAEKIVSSIPWPEKTLAGNFQAELLDLSPIYDLIPVISRLKAKPILQGEIKGNLSKPIVTLNMDLGTGIFSIPKQRITIKEFRLHIAGTWGQDLTVTSSGTTGGNPFYIQGNWDPSKIGMPGEFQLTGKNLRIFNTANIRILASPNLSLKYLAQTLLIRGKVAVVEGDIVLKKELNSVIISDDVVFTGNNIDEHPESIQVLPQIELTIQDNVHFKGYGLDTHVKGKLYIERRKDRLYTGQGRIVLREGKYRLPNGTGNIHRGYLYYPPGTLLQSPVLEIRVLQRARDKFNENGDVGVYVQGSLQKPVYHLYSSEPLKQNEILSKLGFGGTQVEGEDNQRKMAQTAVLLGSGANPLLEDIQSKFGLEEFGIQSGNASKYIATQEGNDATLVVGKALGERWYLQFMQGMLIPNSTLKLQYFITPNVAVSGETSTTGLGGDISFSVEKD